jgi:predicted phosphoribosyltransferase
MRVEFQRPTDAGHALATRLQRCLGAETVVFGVGARGLTVAAEVARQLKAPFDLLLLQPSP